MFDKPFIHLFSTSQGFYLFDVNTDKILKLPPEVYEYLENPSNSIQPSKHILAFLDNLICNGYLKYNRVKESEHPLTETLPFYLSNSLSHMILQVTQNCNLRCSYCVYSGKYKNRVHSQKNMDIITAQKAIDYLISHSRDSNELVIGFYGGEPLLRLEMIKQCVDYANNNAEGRKVKYAITTNGTLLTEENVSYLFNHNFSITISLDGPKSIHDKYRRYAGNNKGTYDILMDNVQMIKNKFSEFYKTNLLFNTVLVPENGFSCVDEFVMNEEIINDAFFISSIVDDRYTDNIVPYSEDYMEEYSYEIFKLMLKKLNWLKASKVSKLVEDYITHVNRVRGGKHSSLLGQLPEKYHHGGPCLPGVARLFVNADGNLYPCERVSEASEVSKIGDINNGIDLFKAERILNIEKKTSSMCHNCWAYCYCSICIGSADDLHEISSDMIKKACNHVRNNIENMFKDYCVLRELGYDFEAEDSFSELTNF